MKILFLSDLHLGDIPRNEYASFFVLFNKVKQLNPDYVIFGGDNIEWHRNWENFLATYKRLLPETKTSIILGNHDFWSYSKFNNDSRESVYSYIFDVCKKFDVGFLEEEPIVHDNILLCGTSVWYDYSIKPEHVNKEFLITNKSRFNNDGNYIISEFSDEEYADICNKRLLSNIRKNQKLVDHIFVFTHIPIFKECIIPTPPNRRQEEWEMSNCYFYNVTLGKKIIKNKKIKLVVSGHIHRPMRGFVDHIQYVTSGSDYHRPEIVSIDFNENEEIFINRIS